MLRTDRTYTRYETEPYKLGTDHMLGHADYVPLTTNNFEVRIYDINGVQPSFSAINLTLSTDEIGSVSEDQDIITVHYGNGLIKFPAKVNFGNIDWTLNCYCKPGVLSALREWRRLVYDPDTQKMGIPEEYMMTVYFIKYDGRGVVRDVIKCPGTWIGALDNGSMNQQGGDVVKVKVPFIISRVIYSCSDENGDPYFATGAKK